MSKKLDQTEGRFKLVGNIKKFKEDKNVRSADDNRWSSINLQVDTGDGNSPTVSVMGFKPDAKREVTLFKAEKGKETQRVKVKATEVAQAIKKYTLKDGWQVGGGVTIRTPKLDGEGKVVEKDGKTVYNEVSLTSNLAVTQLKNLLNKRFNREDAQPVGVSVSGDVTFYQKDADSDVRVNYNLKRITFLENPFTEEHMKEKPVHVFATSGVFDSSMELPDGRVAVNLRHIDFKEQVTVGTYVVDSQHEDERVRKIANTLLNSVTFGALIKVEGLIINKPNIVSAQPVEEDGGGDDDFDFAEMFGDFSDEKSDFERTTYDGYISELQIKRVLEFKRDVYTEDDFMPPELEEDDLFGDSGSSDDGEDLFAD